MNSRKEKLKSVETEILQNRSKTYHTIRRMMKANISKEVIRDVSMKLGFGLQAMKKGTIEGIEKRP